VGHNHASVAAAARGGYAGLQRQKELMSHKIFVQRRRLAWGEADPAGTIYAPRAIDFAIQAIEALWMEALGVSFRDFQARHGLGAPWVHTSCEFSSPLRAGEAFDLAIALDKLGTSSLEWRGEAKRPEGEALFRLKLVSVVIDLASGASRAIPADMRAGLKPYVARKA
jgi:4-hydroxybenzoyl-CoA thioesterase